MAQQYPELDWAEWMSTVAGYRRLKWQQIADQRRLKTVR